ncbi:hypothetical protein EYF80_053357 [Liparis tanakae]|uniref:Uncharacterized protein n=1 Tax=Liparis tanakae TaxID=230148 RepID=A0A4Z2F5G4_9TELE|nr:hypothetical protein EYF80_053357 [Liparis tanakae]
MEGNASRWRALALKPFLNPFPSNWPRVQRAAVCSELSDGEKRDERAAMEERTREVKCNEDVVGLMDKDLQGN